MMATDTDFDLSLWESLTPEGQAEAERLPEFLGQ